MSLLALACAAGSVACGSDDGDDGQASGGASSGGSAGAAGTGTGGGAGAGTGGAGGAGGSGGGGPSAQFLPTINGPCPEIGNGTFTFNPKGIAPRKVQIYMSDAAKTLDGPLIFYWHGTGSFPGEAAAGLGASMNAIKDAGGIVVAPQHDPAAGTFPWFLTTGGTRVDDLLVADEVLACAIDQLGVDTSRIHTMGMSAGALMTTQMAYRRSGYIASAVTYSGGLIGAPPAAQDPSNKYAAMMFHGGTSDVVVIKFQAATEAWLADITGKQQFGFICNHGRGHSVPTDAVGSVWQFFQDHPFGTPPDPYASALPQGFPSYCSL